MSALESILYKIIVIALVPFVPLNVSDVFHVFESGQGNGQIVYQTSTTRQSEVFEGPHKTDVFSLGVVTSAGSALVIDEASSAVLFEKDADTPRSIGSITKLMTALVFLDSETSFNATAQILQEDIRYGGVQYVLPNDPVRVQDLFSASLIGSDNTSSAALMRLSGLGERDFIGRMNQKAKELGMTQSTFVDATGLSSHNRASARDVSKLIQEATKTPKLQEVISKSEAVFVGQSGYTYNIPSTDELLQTFLNKPPYKVIGAKTGYLPEAGYCLSVRVTKNGSSDLLLVVLGSESKVARFDDVKALSSWAYKTFSWETDPSNL